MKQLSIGLVILALGVLLFSTSSTGQPIGTRPGVYPFQYVVTFNGRPGVVIPLANDYSFSQISGQISMGQIAQTGATNGQAICWQTSTYIPCTVSSGSTFVDQVTPTGTINGSNTVFTLSGTPNPAADLQVFLNGLLLVATVDYTLATSTVTFASAPLAGDSIKASWRQ